MDGRQDAPGQEGGALLGILRRHQGDQPRGLLRRCDLLQQFARLAEELALGQDEVADLLTQVPARRARAPDPLHEMIR